MRSTWQIHGARTAAQSKFTARVRNPVSIVSGLAAVWAGVLVAQAAGDAAPAEKRDREGQRRAAVALCETGAYVEVTVTEPDGDWWVTSLSSSRPLPEHFDYVSRVGLGSPYLKDPQKAFRQLRHLPDVTRLDLTGFASTDVDWAALSHLEKLKSLWANRSCIRDSGLEHLDGCRELEYANLADTEIKGLGFARLTKLDRLKELILVGTPLKNQALDYIGQLRCLETLRLAGTPIGDAGCLLLGRHAGTLQHLEELGLHGTRVGDAGCTGLSLLSSLKRLNLDDTDVGDEGCAELKKLPQLEELTLLVDNLGDAGLAHLAEATSLVTLWVSGDGITDDGLAPLKRLPRLERFLVPLNVSARGLEHVAEFPALRHLSIGAPISEQGPVSDRDLRYLEPLGDRLEVLDLSRLRIDGSGLAALKDFKKLRSLYLQNTRIDDDALRHLAGIRTLEALFLDGTPITGEGLAHLANLPQLVYLSLRGTRITSRAIAPLAECPRLGGLGLSDTEVDDSVIPYLAKMRSLSNVSLNGTAVSKDGIKALAKAKPHARISG